MNAFTPYFRLAFVVLSSVARLAVGSSFVEPATRASTRPAPVLRWKFYEGERLRVRSESVTTLSLTSQGKTTAEQYEGLFEFLWQVDQIESGGTAHITLKIERVRQYSAAPGDVFAVDTAAPEERDAKGLGGHLAFLLRPVEAHFTMTARGELTDVRVDAKSADRLREAASLSLAPVKAALSADGLTLTIRNIVVPLSNVAVRPGDEWSDTARLGIAPRTVRRTFRYMGSSDADGRTLESIDLGAGVDFGDARKDAPDQQSSGTLLFDADAGRMESHELTLRVRRNGVENGQPVVAEAVGTFKSSVRPADYPLNPRPRDGFKPAAAQVEGLMGKGLYSREVQGFLRSLPGRPEERGLDHVLFVSDRQAGISLRISREDGVVTQIGFYATDPLAGWEGYTGELPGNLTLSDRRRAVEQRLGRPPLSSGGTGMVRYNADYPSRGIWIEYERSRARDPENPIRFLSLNAPDPKAQAATPVHPTSPRLTIRLVDDRPGGAAAVDSVADPDGGPGATMRLLRDVLLDESAVAEVDLFLKRADKGRDVIAGIEMKFTPEGARRLEKLSAEHTGQRIALLLDGRVLLVPRIEGKMSANVVINAGVNASEAETRAQCARLHAAVNVLPR